MAPCILIIEVWRRSFNNFCFESEVTMRNPLRISFDLDGVVLMDQGPQFIQFLKNDCGLSFDDAEFARSHSWIKALGKGVPDINGLFARFATLGPSPKFAPGAQRGLSCILEFAEVHINTARHGQAFTIALSVLSDAGIAWHGAHEGMSRRKHLALVEHDIFWHVEDSAEDIQIVIAECDHASVVQFPSYAPGAPPQAIIHERVHVLPSFYEFESFSQGEILEKYWTEMVVHFEALCAVRV